MLYTWLEAADWWIWRERAANCVLLALTRNVQPSSLDSQQWKVLFLPLMGSAVPPPPSLRASPHPFWPCLHRRERNRVLCPRESPHLRSHLTNPYTRVLTINDIVIKEGSYSLSEGMGSYGCLLIYNCDYYTQRFLVNESLTTRNLLVMELL